MFDFCPISFCKNVEHRETVSLSQVSMVETRVGCVMAWDYHGELRKIMSRHGIVMILRRARARARRYWVTTSNTVTPAHV
ncbi:hypothetical protein Scep_007458 [Stephania cephalantha]|uniref:Uncharacterized protein n=1 Tax=Stephania cephalantha TaxID=152367 RepID=A0AAP0K9X2_9MAGN